MGGHALVRWLFAKHQLQSAASSIDVFDDGSEIDCVKSCWFCYHIFIAVDRDLEQNTCLQDDLTYDH